MSPIHAPRGNRGNKEEDQKRTEEKAHADNPKRIGLHSEVMEQPITQTLEQNYMPYAMSTNVSRAFPEIDGFKPSHRKLLYTMYKMGLLNGARQKSANIVDQTMKFNRTAIPPSMRPWCVSPRATKLLAPFVESGWQLLANTIPATEPAASRYTEASRRLRRRFSKTSMPTRSTSWTVTTRHEGLRAFPPTTFPTFSCRQTRASALPWSDICGFNLNEVCTATMHSLKRPECDLPEYMPAPEPTIINHLTAARRWSTSSTRPRKLPICSRWRCYLPDERIIEVRNSVHHQNRRHHRNVS